MITKIIKKLCKLSNFTYALYLMSQMLKQNGFLYETGWKKSVKMNMPVNKSGDPLPWFTFSFLDFFLPRLKKDFEIFEYGCGNSTLYYSNKVHKIYAVEHNIDYYNFIKKQISSQNNVHLICEEDLKKYPSTIKDFNKCFDIIVIDGRMRVACIYEAIDKLKNNGVIVFDNSLRSRYKEGVDFLHKKGFKSIDFKGLNALGFHNTVTSIFYKKDNILDI